jgi:hypothetical protein
MVFDMLSAGIVAFALIVILFSKLIDGALRLSKR